jgi:hypothetical protein
VQWYLLVQAHNDVIDYFEPGVATSLPGSAESAAPPFADTERQVIDVAMAQARAALNDFQQKVCEDTQDLSAPDEPQFAQAGDDLIRSMWIHGRAAARGRIEEMKETTRCEELKDFLRSVMAIRRFHTTDPGISP